MYVHTYIYMYVQKHRGRLEGGYRIYIYIYICVCIQRASERERVLAPQRIAPRLLDRCIENDVVDVVLKKFAKSVKSNCSAAPTSAICQHVYKKNLVSSDVN